MQIIFFMLYNELSLAKYKKFTEKIRYFLMNIKMTPISNTRHRKQIYLPFSKKNNLFSINRKLFIQLQLVKIILIHIMRFGFHRNSFKTTTILLSNKNFRQLYTTHSRLKICFIAYQELFFVITFMLKEDKDYIFLVVFLSCLKQYMLQYLLK